MTAVTGAGETMTGADTWQVILFLVIPLFVIYILLVLWTTHKDKWKR